MSLLDSILTASNADQYIDNFKKHKIEASTLKILTEEDLILLGVQEEITRKLIIEHATNLQISAEKINNIIIDEKYILTVLSQISLHLPRQKAAISIAAHRKDTIICDIRLNPATKTLDNAVRLLQEKLDKFEEKVITREKTQNRLRYVTPIAIISLMVLTTYKLRNSYLCFAPF